MRRVSEMKTKLIVQLLEEITASHEEHLRFAKKLLQRTKDNIAEIERRRREGPTSA